MIVDAAMHGRSFKAGPRWSDYIRDISVLILAAGCIPGAMAFSVVTRQEEYSPNVWWWAGAWSAGLTALFAAQWLSRLVMRKVVLGANHVTLLHLFGRTTTMAKCDIHEVYLTPEKPLPPSITFVVGDRPKHIRGLLYRERNTLLEAIERDDQLWLTDERTAASFSKIKKGGRKRFERYLGDQSTVEVADIAELERWLREATTYRPDGRRDIWNSPSEFEEHLAGDCDDHAVWAWTKLHRLGHAPEFVVGQMKISDDEWGKHAWVRFYDNGQLMNLEATIKVGDMIVPWSEAKHRYEVGAGVSAELRAFKYPVSVRYLQRESRA